MKLIDKMNTIRGLVITILVTLVISIIVGLGIQKVQAKAKIKEYPAAMVVVSINKENDSMKLVDYHGDLWEVSGAKGWQVDDLAAVILSDNGTTDTFLDDEIVSVRWNGSAAAFGLGVPAVG